MKTQVTPISGPTLRTYPTLCALHNTADKLRRKGLRIDMQANGLCQTLPLENTKELLAKASIYRASCNDGAHAIYELLRSMGCKLDIDSRCDRGSILTIPDDVSEAHFGLI